MTGGCIHGCRRLRNKCQVHTCHADGQRVASAPGGQAFESVLCGALQEHDRLRRPDFCAMRPHAVNDSLTPMWVGIEVQACATQPEAVHITSVSFKGFVPLQLVQEE